MTPQDVLRGLRAPRVSLWIPLLAVAAAGAVAAAVAVRVRGGGELPWDLGIGPPGPDPEALDRVIAELPAGAGLRTLHLGEGIVEVVGSAASEPAARQVLDAAAEVPGVRAVVNRIWTPSSADHNVSDL